MSSLQRHHRLPQDLSHLSSEDLCAELGEAMKALAGLMESKRNRDKAGQMVTYLWSLLTVAAARVNLREGWDERGRKPVEEEDERHGREAWDEGGDPARVADGEEPMVSDMPMADLFRGGGTEVPLADLLEWTTDDEEEALATVLGLERGALRWELGRMVTHLQEEHFGRFLRYLVQGSREIDDVSRKVVALGRRTIPGEMEIFGRSAADIARKARPRGESRAATSAREKREVERPLIDAGANGFKLLGGARSEEHRERCRQAQKGNQNRKGKQSDEEKTNEKT